MIYHFVNPADPSRTFCGKNTNHHRVKVASERADVTCKECLALLEEDDRITADSEEEPVVVQTADGPLILTEADVKMLMANDKEFFKHMRATGRTTMPKKQFRQLMKEAVIKPQRKQRTAYRLQKHNVVKRNDKCPCGSGLKFKRCCLPVEQTIK